MNYKFIFKDKEYDLIEEKCECFFNDEETPINNIEVSNILDLLNKAENINFGLEYYAEPCEVCLHGKEQRKKVFPFLECHFYIFTKDNNYITSSISNDYEENSYSGIYKKGKVDNSYIVSIMICENCGDYIIEIEQCNM